jgi:hypothetical protein
MIGTDFVRKTNHLDEGEGTTGTHLARSYLNRNQIRGPWGLNCPTQSICVEEVADQVCQMCGSIIGMNGRFSVYNKTI